MAEPQQKPGRSKQDYGTPPTLVRAVENRFGPLAWDLAASDFNHKAPRWITAAEDSLSIQWHKLEGLLWLNPPFANIEPWARKCREEADRGARILMLTPASVGSNWYLNNIQDHGQPLFLNPRITFEGCTTPYPKDCMITYFCGVPSVAVVWLWKQNFEQVNELAA